MKNPSLAPKPGQYKDLNIVRSQIQVIDKQLYPALAKVPKNQCRTYNIQEEFKSGFSKVQGIPITPDFSMLMVSSILSIKAK